MKNIIINIIFALTIILFVSCSHKIIKNKETAQPVIEQGFTLGTITDEYKKNGCDYLIKTKVNDKEIIYSAINLDESLKQNGKQFQFTFKPIKAQRKGKCKRGIYIFIKEFKPL